MINNSNKNCPFCNSADNKIIRNIVSPINKKSYTLIQCNSCDIQYFTPLIFENIYEDEIYQEYKEFHTGRNDLPAWTKKIVEVIKKEELILYHKTILEIGAGDCINFKALRDHFGISLSNYYAIEIDKKSIIQCRKRGVKNIFEDYFDKGFLEKLDIKFDLIFAAEVLEHQTKPKEFIETIFNLLNKDGIVILTVPNRDRFLISLRENPADIPPHHFLRFNKSFFLKNFYNQVLILEDFRYQYEIKSFLGAAQNISNMLFKTRSLWFFFYPLLKIIKLSMDCLDKIRGEGLFVMIAKQ